MNMKTHFEIRKNMLCGKVGPFIIISEALL